MGDGLPTTDSPTTAALEVVLGMVVIVSNYATAGSFARMPATKRTREFLVIHPDDLRRTVELASLGWRP